MSPYNLSMTRGREQLNIYSIYLTVSLTKSWPEFWLLILMLTRPSRYKTGWEKYCWGRLISSPDLRSDPPCLYILRQNICLREIPGDLPNSMDYKYYDIKGNVETKYWYLCKTPCITKAPWLWVSWLHFFTTPLWKVSLTTAPCRFWSKSRAWRNVWEDRTCQHTSLLPCLYIPGPSWTERCPPQSPRCRRRGWKVHGAHWRGSTSTESVLVISNIYVREVSFLHF